MPNFKVKFFTFFCGSLEEVENKEDATMVERIFEAQSFSSAEKIANAMVGEGGYYLEHLSRVVSIEETTEKANPNFSWTVDLSAESWWEAYRRLKKKGEFVKIKLDHRENPVSILFENP